MSAARPQFSIDDAFELSLEDAGPGPEPSGVARFGPLHFERRARFEAADEDKQSRLRYQVTGPALRTPAGSGGTPGRSRRTGSGEALPGLEPWPEGEAGPHPFPDVAADGEPCPDPRLWFWFRPPRGPEPGRSSLPPSAGRAHPGTGSPAPSPGVRTGSGRLRNLGQTLSTPMSSPEAQARWSNRNLHPLFSSRSLHPAFPGRWAPPRSPAHTLTPTHPGIPLPQAPSPNSGSFPWRLGPDSCAPNLETAGLPSPGTPHPEPLYGASETTPSPPGPQTRAVPGPWALCRSPHQPLRRPPSLSSHAAWFRSDDSQTRPAPRGAGRGRRHWQGPAVT